MRTRITVAYELDRARIEILFGASNRFLKRRRHRVVEYPYAAAGALGDFQTKQPRMLILPSKSKPRKEP